MGYALTGFVI